ncbi:indole-3-glycerol phosphate synthase TrpC [candidate division KSB1 bacterium]|nr:indole-3-glycerol phosphate synthase TrpC [candidate division KSB1 bacterium]
MNALAEIYARRRAALTTQLAAEPLATLRARAADLPPTRGLEHALRARDSIAVIAEIKYASPSAGVIRRSESVAEIAADYSTNGAAALSILTEPEFFSGALANLGAARNAVSLPLLRKDFLFDPYQIFESRVAGADAILLIAAMLERSLLADLTALARELTLDILLEIHDEADFRKCEGIGPVIWGVNHRDLRSLKIDLETSGTLSRLLPPDSTRVAESGISRPAHLLTMTERGFHAVLVGTSLMQAPVPGRALAELLGRA